MCLIPLQLGASTGSHGTRGHLGAQGGRVTGAFNQQDSAISEGVDDVGGAATVRRMAASAMTSLSGVAWKTAQVGSKRVMKPVDEPLSDTPRRYRDGGRSSDLVRNWGRLDGIIGSKLRHTVITGRRRWQSCRHTRRHPVGGHSDSLDASPLMPNKPVH